jgi:hypothetical protein
MSLLNNHNFQTEALMKGYLNINPLFQEKKKKLLKTEYGGICNLSTWEAEVGESQTQGYSKTLSEKP